MRSGFFNSEIIGYDIENMPIFDRAEEASFFAKYFSQFISNGVFPNPSTNMQVLAGEGMQVKVSIGVCYINGYMGWVEAPETLVIEESEAHNRIDRIVVRLDFEDRTIKAFVKKGEAAGNPVAPELQRDYDIYEIALADVLVTSDSIKITQENITDLRLNTELCGVVANQLQHLDTTTLFNQYQDWLNSTIEDETEFIEQGEADFNEFLTEGKENFQKYLEENKEEYIQYFDFVKNNFSKDFNEWFENLQVVLSGDVAGNLQVEIDKLAKDVKPTRIKISKEEPEEECVWFEISKTTQTEKGPSITINKTIEEKLKKNLISSGNTYQKTSEQGLSPENPSEIRNCGDNVNYFNKYGDFSYGNDNHRTSLQEDGTILSTANNWSASSGILIENLKSNTDYTLSGILKSANGSSAINVVVNVYKEIGVANRIRGFSGAKTLQQPYNWNLTFNTGEATSVWISFNGANETAEGTTITVFDKVKLEKGTKATPYSPYMCGNVNENIENLENMLNWSKFINENSWGDSLSATYKSFKIEGLKASTPYTLCRVDNEGFGQNVYACFNEINNNLNRFIDHANKESNLQFISATSTLKGELYITVYGGIQEAIGIIKSCWIVEGTEYIPHQEQIYSFPTKQGQVFHKGDYIENDQNSHHVRNTIELDGTEDIIPNGSLIDATCSAWILYVDDLSNEINSVICTHLKGGVSQPEFNSIYSLSAQNKSAIRFIIDNNIVPWSTSSAEKMKEWLAQQKANGTPVKIEYELAEEKIEPFSEEQKQAYKQMQNARTYEGTTHIDSPDEIKPEFEVEAVVE